MGAIVKTGVAVVTIAMAVAFSPVGFVSMC